MSVLKVFPFGLPCKPKPGQGQEDMPKYRSILSMAYPFRTIAPGTSKRTASHLEFERHRFPAALHRKLVHSPHKQTGGYVELELPFLWTRGYFLPDSSCFEIPLVLVKPTISGKLLSQWFKARPRMWREFGRPAVVRAGWRSPAPASLAKSQLGKLAARRGFRWRMGLAFTFMGSRDRKHRRPFDR